MINQGLYHFEEEIGIMLELDPCSVTKKGLNPVFKRQIKKEK